MAKLRTRLENYVVRSTGDLVDDLPDDRRTELAEVLHELEGYSPRAAEAEERTDELVAKLENRNAALAKSRARIEELERELDKAQTQVGVREDRVTAELEAERIRVAEREQKFRAELEAREIEMTRRIEAVSAREREVRQADSQLADR